MLMGLPIFARTVGDLVGQGEPTPFSSEPWYLAIVASPVIAAMVVAMALVPWFAGRRRWLVVADCLATIGAWTLMVPFVLVRDLRIAAVWLLAPAALLLAIAVAVAEAAAQTDHGPRWTSESATDDPPMKHAPGGGGA